jgi:hypothetical protein
VENLGNLAVSFDNVNTDALIQRTFGWNLLYPTTSTAVANLEAVTITGRP